MQLTKGPGYNEIVRTFHVKLSKKKAKPAAESTVAGFVNKIQRHLSLEDYPSFTVASISPDFSPVLVFTKKYLRNTLGAASVTAP